MTFCKNNFYLFLIISNSRSIKTFIIFLINLHNFTYSQMYLLYIHQAEPLTTIDKLYFIYKRCNQHCVNTVTIFIFILIRFISNPLQVHCKFSGFLVLKFLLFIFCLLIHNTVLSRQIWFIFIF